MKQRRLLSLIYRARRDLDKAASELKTLSEEEAPEIDEDLVEVHARVDALEYRVTAIEERGTE